MQSSKIKDEFIGRWRLVSCVANCENEEWFPFTENPFGILLYTSSYMMVFISTPDRPAFSSADFRYIAPMEIANDFKNFECYCGEYKLKEEKSMVIHCIENSKVPTLIKKQLKRFYRFYDDSLSLELKTVEPMLFAAKLWHFTLHWKRMIE